MTAPTVTAPAPAAPAAPKAAPPSPNFGDANKILQSSDEDFGQMFGIDKILEGTPFEAPVTTALDDAATEIPSEPIDVPRDDDGEPLPAYREDKKGNLHAPDGKFTSKDGQEPALDEEATTEETVVETVKDGAKPAETEVEEKPTEPVKLATDFDLYDAEDQAIEYPADLKIKFNANGKEVELPLDRTVRLAKMGFYNEEKEQRYEQLDQRNQQLEPFARDLHDEATTLNSHLVRILAGDDEFLAKAREFYARETSPEAENARLRARVEQLEKSPRPAVGSANAPQQAAVAVAPIIESLIESNKDVVPEAEIWRHMEKLTAPYRDKAGVIPPDRLRDVVATVQGALKLTVESLAETRRLAAKTTAEADREKKIARGKVLELKRKVTTAARPTGQRPAAGTGPTPTPKSTNPTAEDTIETALQGAIGRMRAGG